MVKQNNTGRNEEEYDYAFRIIIYNLKLKNCVFIHKKTFEWRYTFALHANTFSKKSSWKYVYFVTGQYNLSIAMILFLNKTF